MNIRTVLGGILILKTLLLLGCSRPSSPTSVGFTLIDSELTNLLEEEVRQDLNTMSIRRYEKSISICPKGVAEIKVVVDSVEDTTSSYLTNVAMIVSKNGEFQIEIGDRGKPVNRGDKDIVVMTIPYLITCSKVGRFSESFGQNLIEVYSDGRIQVD